MPSLTIPNSFSSNTTAQSAQVNANFNVIATLLNSTLLANDNIQTGGIATANLAANCVTGAKLASSCADGSTLQYTSSTLSIKTGGVGTTQLADASVTQAKRAALGHQLSSTCGVFTVPSGSFSDVTNLTTSQVSTGRPVALMLVPDGNTTNQSNISMSAESQLDWIITRDGTTIGYGVVEISGGAMNIPVSGIATVDTGNAAATYTYKVRAKFGGAAVTINYAKLLSYEL